MDLYKNIFDVDAIRAGIDAIIYKIDDCSFAYMKFAGFLTLWGIISLFIWGKYIRSWTNTNKLDEKKPRKEVIKGSTILIIVSCIFTFTIYTCVI